MQKNKIKPNQTRPRLENYLPPKCDTVSLSAVTKV